MLFYRLCTRSARTALSTASTMTPTSAKIAAHMLATPTATRARQEELDDKREDDVLVYDAEALAGDADGLGNLHGVIVHQYDVGSFDGSVGSHRAHGDSDIRAGQNRRVVDAVADEGKLLFGLAGGEQFFDFIYLVSGQQIAVDFIDTKFRGNRLRDFSSIAGQHNRLAYAGAAKLLDGFLRVRFYDIGDNDMSGVGTVHRHVDDRADTVAVLIRNSELLHQFTVACGNRDAVHFCQDAVAADFFDVGHAAAVDFFAVGPLQALADRVGGSTFGQSGILQQLFILHFIVVHTADFEYALRQRSGFIEYNAANLRECLEVVGSFD